MAAQIGSQRQCSVWRVVPSQTPRILRPCPRCGGMRRFASSDRFRINAQQRRVDVWLIYRCCGCEATWNCTLFRRRLPEEIGSDLYERFQLNDVLTAWTYAFDVERLKSLGVVIEPVSEFQVERQELRSSAHAEPDKGAPHSSTTSHARGKFAAQDVTNSGNLPIPIHAHRELHVASQPSSVSSVPRRIRFAIAFGMQVRLDRVLSRQLGVSRSVLERWFQRGALRCEPMERNALRKPVREGQVIVLEVEAEQAVAGQ